MKRAKPFEEQLKGAQIFSATPPIKSVYSLMSAFMTKEKGNSEKKLMASWDISRAHFMGKAQRDLFVELPPEDRELPGDTGPMRGS